MKKIIFLIAMSLSLSAEARLASHWYDLEASVSNKSRGDEVELQETLDAITSSQLSILKSQDESNKIFGYKLSGLKTVLALGLSGKIGIKSWGGSKAIELNWERKSSAKENTLEEGLETISLHGNMDEVEWERVLSDISKKFESEGIIEGATGLSNYLLKETRIFRELIKGADRVNHPKFEVEKLRMDINLGFSNSVAGYFVKIGSDLRFRFEWRPIKGAGINKETPSQIQKQMTDLTQKMGGILIDAMEEEYLESKKRLDDKYRLKGFSLGVAVSVEGNLGFTKGGQGVGAFVYFRPIPHKTKSEKLDGDIEFISEVEEKIWPFNKKRIFKISKRRIKKGIKKAIRFGHYFSKKIKSKEKSEWAVKTLKTSYKFSLKGKIGLVTVKGSPSIEISYLNTEFKKNKSKEKLELFSKQWGLNTLRIRTRFKGGIEIPWLAKLEASPFIETYYKR